jgi:hypothetical protein
MVSRFGSSLYRHSWTSLPTSFISAQRISKCTVLTNPRPLSQASCIIKQYFVIYLMVDFVQVRTGKPAGWKIFATFWCVVVWCDIVRDVFSWGRSAFAGLRKRPRSATAVGSTWEWHSPPLPSSVFADYIRETDEPLLASQHTRTSNFYTTLQRNSRFGLKSHVNVCILQFHPFGKLTYSGYRNTLCVVGCWKAGGCNNTDRWHNIILVAKHTATVSL